MLSARAHAKVNLALVVGSQRPEGTHEIVTVTEKLALADTITVQRAEELHVEGFVDDTLVTAALEAIATRAAEDVVFAATIEKRIPVAAGLGGGSSDAATSLRLANSLLAQPLATGDLHDIAASIGADVPLFLRPGPQLGTGDGTMLDPITLPRDYHLVLWLPAGSVKGSTAAVYRDFDERHGEVGFEARRKGLLDTLTTVETAADLGRLPPNDLASSSHADELAALGAFRADVSGAGPTVYGLFTSVVDAGRAAAALADRGWSCATTVADDA